MKKDEEFVGRLNEAMELKRFNKADLARVMAMAYSTVDRWFHGSRPQLRTVRLLAKALGVEEGWLNDGTGDMHKRNGEVRAAVLDGGISGGRLTSDTAEYTAGREAQGISALAEDLLAHVARFSPRTLLSLCRDQIDAYKSGDMEALQRAETILKALSAQLDK